MNRFSVFAFVLLAAGAAQAAQQNFDRTFTVTPGGTLVVDADAASVRVTGSDSNQVVVHMTFKGSEEELSKMKVDAVQQGDAVTVTMRRREKNSWFSWSWNSEGRIEVSVPRRYALNVRTGGGDVEAREVNGTLKLQTSGGDVTAKSLTGSVELRTSGGTITADAIKGDIDANTSGGDLRLLNIDGKIKGHTSGGSVRVSLVGANREISASTSGGDIELSLPKNTTGYVDATTSGGEITSDLPVTTNSVKEGQLKGSLNGGGPPIDVHTSGGSIRLRATN